MVFNPNAYNYSSDLSRIANSLGKAMFGSAADDAAIAKAKLANAQAAGQTQENEFLKQRNDAISAAATPDGILAQQLLGSMGMQLDAGNNLTKVLPQGSPQMSVPALPNQTSMSRDDILSQTGGLARALFGDGTYNPNQLADALGGFGKSRDENLARSMIFDPATTQDALRRAAMVLNQDQVVKMDMNTADNIAAGERNTADNIAAGERNTADNIAAAERNKADNIAAGERNTADNIAAGERNDADNRAAAEKPGEDKRKRPSAKDTNANYAAITEAVDNYDTIPQVVRGKLRSSLFANIDAAMGQDKSASYDAVYAKAVTEVLSAGVTEIDTAYGDDISDFGFPTYFYNQLQGRDANFITEVAKDLGYSQKQITALVNQLAEVNQLADG